MGFQERGRNVRASLTAGRSICPLKLKAATIFEKAVRQPVAGILRRNIFFSETRNRGTEALTMPISGFSINDPFDDTALAIHELMPCLEMRRWADRALQNASPNQPFPLLTDRMVMREWPLSTHDARCVGRRGALWSVFPLPVRSQCGLSMRNGTFVRVEAAQRFSTLALAIGIGICRHVAFLKFLSHAPPRILNARQRSPFIVHFAEHERVKHDALQLSLQLLRLTRRE